MQETPKKRQKTGGKPMHKPTDETREAVVKHARIGTPQTLIADILDIDPKTLRKYYRKELDHATALANADVGNVLYAKAMSGDTTAMLFWMRTRAGFKETNAVDVYQNQGPAPTNPQDLTDEQIAEFIIAHAENAGDGVADETES